MRIGALVAAGWPLEVVIDGQPRAGAPLVMPASADEPRIPWPADPTLTADIRGVLQRIRARRPTGEDVVIAGRALFDALVRPMWPDIEAAPVPPRGVIELALGLEPDSPLGDLPWEAMHNGT